MKVAWENDEVSMGIFNAKYSKDNETPEQFCKRVASIVPAEIRSSVESMLADGTFMFGGRTLYIAGRDDGHRASSSNCYVLPSPEDNLESIYDINKKMARVFSMGGGVGITIDNLRPKGAKVHNGAHTSTGAVSFLNVFNTTGEVVGANGRRAAIMVALDCNHPDIEEFLHIKEENNKLSAMNISIKFTRNFMEAVQNNEDVTLYFLAKDTGEVSTKVINAKKFWDDFCKVNWDYGDPGCIFIDRVRDWNMLSGYDNYLINVSNPCSEFFGNDYSACNLGSLNLYHFVDNPFTPEAVFNFDKFKTAVKVAINALNAVLDYGYNRQPFDENRKCITDWRQIGLGVFGYADMLVAMCQRYGSRDAIRLTADVFSTMQEMAIHESAILAAKDGPFKQYNYNKTAASAMFRSLPDTLQYVVKRMGLRNGALLSIAPSGSISLLAGRYSGGCEPLYKLYYERTSHKMEDSGKSFKIYSKSIEDLLKFNNLPLDLTTEEIEEKFPWVIESQQIPIADRVSTQSVMQMFIDNAISSTVNLPEDATPEDISNVYMSAYLNGCKGITVFRDNCKRGNILGVKHDEPTPIILHDSIKPEHRSNIGVLTGKTFTVQSGDGTNLYVTINWKDGKMFEVFVSTERHAHEVAGITRMVSLAMRCGVSIQSIIEQLFKLSADSIGFAIGTALNDAYAFEDTGQLVQEVEVTKHKDGFVCPECGGKDVKLVGHCWECAVCGAGGCSV